MDGIKYYIRLFYAQHDTGKLLDVHTMFNRMLLTLENETLILKNV